MKLEDLKVSTRLACGFAVPVLLAVAMAGFGLLQTHNTNLTIGSIHADRAVPLEQLEPVSDMYAVNIIDNANEVSRGLLEPKAQELVHAVALFKLTARALLGSPCAAWGPAPGREPPARNSAAARRSTDQRSTPNSAAPRRRGVATPPS